MSIQIVGPAGRQDLTAREKIELGHKVALRRHPRRRAHRQIWNRHRHRHARHRARRVGASPQLPQPARRTVGAISTFTPASRETSLRLNVPPIKPSPVVPVALRIVPGPATSAPMGAKAFAIIFSSSTPSNAQASWRTTSAEAKTTLTLLVFRAATTMITPSASCWRWPRIPTSARVLAVGLGCEYTQPHRIAEAVRASGRPAESFFIQEHGGTEPASRTAKSCWPRSAPVPLKRRQSAR